MLCGMLCLTFLEGCVTLVIEDDARLSFGNALLSDCSRRIKCVTSLLGTSDETPCDELETTGCTPSKDVPFFLEDGWSGL